MLGVKQESGEGAAEGGLSAAAQVVPDDAPPQVRGETDIEQPYPGVGRVRGAGELLFICPARNKRRTSPSRSNSGPGDGST